MAIRGKKNGRRENEIAEGRIGEIHLEVREIYERKLLGEREKAKLRGRKKKCGRDERDSESKIAREYYEKVRREKVKEGG